jgi:hypothetical protein
MTRLLEHFLWYTQTWLAVLSLEEVPSLVSSPSEPSRYEALIM